MVATTRPRTIFISYRRDDTKAEAGRLYDRLADHFGEERVFMDVDSISPGRDFVEQITSFVGSCDVLIGLIGSKWLTSVDTSGGRRIDDPHDFVRLEIETALRRDVAVIPILVQGAEGLQTDDLPSPLQGLARHQVLKITHEDFRAQTSRLIESIERLPRRGEAAVEATSIGFKWMRILVRLDEEHRITLDNTWPFSSRIDVDGQILFKGWSFDRQYDFSVGDGNRRVPASIHIGTGPLGAFTSVILAIDGATVYDSATKRSPRWREESLVTKTTPIGLKNMDIVLQLQDQHTISIDNRAAWPRRSKIEIDGQLAVRKLDLAGEHKLEIKDASRLVPASIALEISPLNNLSKVVLTVDGAIVYES